MVERAAIAEALFEEKERAQVTLNSIGDAVMSTDVPGHVTYLNVVAERMTGWSREEAAGHPLEEVFRIIDATTREAVQNPMALAIRENKTVGLTAELRPDPARRSGSRHRGFRRTHPRPPRTGDRRRHGVSRREHARALSLRMSYLAQHDSLTDLPNRVLVERPTDPGDGPGSPSPADNWRCCSWTWIASRTSTTPWATTSATACCSPWRSGLLACVRSIGHRQPAGRR